MSIKTQEHGDKWLSGFGAQWNDNWNEGDTVDITVEQKGEYLNFNRIDPVEELKIRVAKLEAQVFGTTASEPVGTPTVQDDDLPW